MAKNRKKYKRDIHVPRGIQIANLLPDINLLGRRFVPWGRDNLQPNRVINAISNSPTAAGASSVYSDFIGGQGFVENGDLVVNREGHTLNDILEFATIQKSIFGDFSLHFNFNLLGQINEIQMMKMQLIRIGNELDTVIIQNWDLRQGSYGDNEFFIYNISKLSAQITKSKGFDNFKGAIYFKPSNMDLYPSLFAQAAMLSFEFEKDVQITNLAFIKNGMKSSGVLKLPSQTSGSEADKKDKAQLKRLHDPGNAGSIITLNMPVNAEGDSSSAKIFESFDIPNIDRMFINQVKTAKDYILEAYKMPEILLGISSDGMFNSGSFSEAFVYFNGKTGRDRTKVQGDFNSFMKNSVWQLNDLEIEPLSLDQFVTPVTPKVAEGKPKVVEAKVPEKKKKYLFF